MSDTRKRGSQKGDGRRSGAGSVNGNGGAARPARDGGDDRITALNRLLDAASGLAVTIAATEQLAQARAEILTRRSTLLGPARESGFRGQIISLAEAGRRTGRHPEVLRRWCQEGRIEAVRVGRTWGITPRTLALLLAHSGRSRPRLPTSGSA